MGFVFKYFSPKYPDNSENSKSVSFILKGDISGNCLTRFEVIDENEKGLTFVKRKPTAGCGDKYKLITRYNGVLDPTASVSGFSTYQFLPYP